VSQAISWHALVSLCQRYHRRVSRGQHAHGVTVAMARELIGFMWAMAKEVPRIAEDEDGS
jgi:transposase